MEHPFARLKQVSLQAAHPIIFALIAIFVGLYAFYPTWDWANTRFQAEKYAVDITVEPQVSSLSSLITLSRQSPKVAGDSSIVDVPLNLFSAARVVVQFYNIKDPNDRPPAPARAWTSGDQKVWVVPRDTAFVVRWDLLIFSAGLLVIAFVITLTLRTQNRQPSNVVSEVGVAPQNITLRTSEDYLVADVERALQRSEELFSRSTLLLAGGVVMAFVGVGVFFVSFSEATNYGAINISAAASSNVAVNSPGPEQTILGISSRQLFLGFKSTAMLVFIEAIAWFLLRQYRALIEDYKSFYRYYMRRANYLTALKLVTENSDTKSRSLLVETLLDEDLSGRLRKGETTEVLEGQRAIDGNFVESIVATGANVVAAAANTTNRAVGSNNSKKKAANHSAGR